MSQITTTTYGVKFPVGGNPDKTNVATLENPGELGAVFNYQGKRYQRVKADSGCTSANPVGAIAANQVAFWKDKAAKIVTNDFRQAVGASVANAPRNFVAGVFRIAATGGYYIDILQKGLGISVASDGNGGAGQTAIADATASTAQVTAVAVGSASTYQKLGTMTAAASNSLITVDLDISSVEN